MVNLNSTNPADSAQNDFSLAEQIRISKRELETVFDAISEFICILDNNYRLIRVNRSYSLFVKKPIREILGKPCYKVFWNRDSICENCPSERTFATGEPVLKKRFTWKGSDAVRYFETNFYPVFDEAGKIVRVIEYTRDMTEEKRVFEQLIHSEKLASIGVMTAGIAHEMNNPLSGNFRYCGKFTSDAHKIRTERQGNKQNYSILESAAHATTIMNDLLHLSRKHETTSKRWISILLSSKQRMRFISKASPRSRLNSVLMNPLLR